MTEVYGYVWDDDGWCGKLGYHPENSLTLRNPPAAGLERLRQTLISGLLAAADLNRHHLNEFRIVELGSAFVPDGEEHIEHRRVGLISAVRRKGADSRLLAELKGAVDAWARHVRSTAAEFHEAEAIAGRPWESAGAVATIHVGDVPVGRTGVVPFDLRRRIDEHLGAWSIVWAEIDLEGLLDLVPPVEPLRAVPSFPEVDLDFSVLVDQARRYEQVVADMGRFEDALLRSVHFVDAYEGKSVPAGKRALTFRTRIGHAERTLVEDDLVGFRKSFEGYLIQHDMELRKA